jgi:hypothetical protein
MTDRTSNQQPSPRRNEVLWGAYQWGRLWHVGHSRKDAREYVERVSGHPWKKAREYFRIVRVKVNPL